MTLVLLTLAAGLATGLARGGRLSALGRVSFARVDLLFAALIAQLLLDIATGPAVAAALVAAQLIPLAFLWANRRLPGMRAVATGFALNALVILANGVMPVSAAALDRVGSAALLATGRHRLLQPGDTLAPLADVIPLPWLGSVVSVGDLILAVGAGLLLAGATRAASPASPPDPRAGTPAASSPVPPPPG